MDGYNFWQDLFDTYQSLSDWMKFAWLVVPPAFLLGFVALVMRYRLVGKRASASNNGRLAYTVISDENGGLRIYTHDGADALAAARSDMAVLPVPRPKPAAIAKPRSSDV